MRKLALAVLASLCLSLPAQAIDMKKGKLGHLSKFIGTDEVEKVVDDPEVRKSLTAVMPGSKIPELKNNLQVRGPIDFIDGNLVLNGNAPHAGDTDTASVWLSVYDGKARVVLQSRGKMTLYAKDGDYGYLPLSMRAHIAVAKGRMQLDSPPAFLDWPR